MRTAAGLIQLKNASGVWMVLPMGPRMPLQAADQNLTRAERRQVVAQPKALWELAACAVIRKNHPRNQE